MELRLWVLHLAAYHICSSAFLWRRWGSYLQQSSTRSSTSGVEEVKARHLYTH